MITKTQLLHYQQWSRYMKLSTQETAHRFFLEIRQIKYYREGVILIWGLDFYLVMLTFPFCIYIFISLV